MNTAEESPLLISYLTLRKLIGLLGLLFPLILLMGGYLTNTQIQNSISYYYYTPMNDIFVGILCMVAAFFLAYQGYDNKDAIAGRVAGLSAIGVALVPTVIDCKPTETQIILGYLHLFFAMIYFSSIAYFCLFLFTQSKSCKQTLRKKQRNLMYKICGYTIIISLIFIAIYTLVPNKYSAAFDHLNPIFWLESIAIVSFGYAWLIKGETLFKDLKSKK